MKFSKSKKILSTILAFVMITCTGAVSFSSFAASTNTVTVGDVTYEISENCITKVTVKDGVSLGNYTVPDKVGGIAINSIGACAYKGVNVTALTIPKSVEQIGGGAFRDCTSLETVYYNSSSCVMPSDTIGYTDSFYSLSPAFFECSSLTTVVFGDNVTSIPANACTNIPSLKTVTFLAKVTAIGSNAFTFCTSLENVDMSNITTIGNGAFSNCTTFETVSLPKAITIDGEAFSGCSNIKSVSFPKAASIGDCAFMGTGITEITIPKSVEKIGGGAFRDCSSLETVYYNSPNCVMPSDTIGYPDSFYSLSPAFFECSSLTTVVFGDNVTSIPANACTNIPSMETVTFLAKVTSIGKNAFALCTSLENIDMSNLTTIEGGAFYNCTTFETVSLPKAITIDGEAFSGCSNIKSVSFPKATSIGDCAFMGTGITEITIPKSVEKIGGGAFRDCSSLETVYYNSPNCVMPSDTIGYTDSFYGFSPAFFRDSSLTTIVFGNNVTSIPANACTGVYSLETVEFKAVAEAMGENAFYGISTPDMIKYAGTEAQWIALEDTAESGNEKLFACTNYKFNSKPDTDEPITIENEDAGVQVECQNGCFANDVDVDKIQLNVEKTSADAEVDRIVKDYALTRVLGMDVYNISLSYEDEEIQPNGKVTVKIPYSGTINDISKVKIFHYYEENNELVAERITGVKLINGYLEFETEHFSNFVLVEEGFAVTSGDISINYKSNASLNTSFVRSGKSEYKVEYSSSNEKVARVDENGNVYGASKGTATITANLVDGEGKVVATDTATVTVTYSFVQWLIKILLFGWIWY